MRTQQTNKSAKPKTLETTFVATEPYSRTLKCGFDTAADARNVGAVGSPEPKFGCATSPARASSADVSAGRTSGDKRARAAVLFNRHSRVEGSGFSAFLTQSNLAPSLGARRSATPSRVSIAAADICTRTGQNSNQTPKGISEPPRAVQSTMPQLQNTRSGFR